MASIATSTITGRLTDALYTEAMLLADELRAYLDGPAVEVRRMMPPRARVLFACESLNANTRLMQVTARLLARRAGGIPAGELTLEEIVAPADETLSALPAEARELIGATLDLHERVRRLEAGVIPFLPPPNPARALFDRLERAF